MHLPELQAHCPPLTLALEAAARAGEILMKYFREGVTIREKAVSDLVSDADVEAEQAVLELIRSTYPDHALLAEESQAAALNGELPEHLWVIDPLDGTTNFAHGLSHFAVSIGYYRHGIAQCGVVFNPARNDLYVAVHGQGAYHNGQRLQVGSQTSLSQCLIGIGFYYDRGAMMEATLATIHALFKQQIHGVRRFGTASLDLAHVASGYYGAYVEYQLHPWDFAAGRLLVEEAGGKVTVARGTDLLLQKGSVLASNGVLHAAMLDVIEQTTQGRY
ncbi:inositol monophosphatase family protein [Planctomicrobium sp. SH664]|uniref:inositol monophosphatase family protein n=1 Tax=Planctomicrobium sp. SH664 TaxID=3448125 RepID=UPI003F5C9F8B